MSSDESSRAPQSVAPAPTRNVVLSPFVNERFPAWEDLLSAHDVARITRRPRWMLAGSHARPRLSCQASLSRSSGGLAAERRAGLDCANARVLIAMPRFLRVAPIPPPLLGPAPPAAVSADSSSIQVGTSVGTVRQSL